MLDFRRDGVELVQPMVLAKTDRLTLHFEVPAVKKGLLPYQPVSWAWRVRQDGSQVT